MKGEKKDARQADQRYALRGAGTNKALASFRLLYQTSRPCHAIVSDGDFITVEKSFACQDVRLRDYAAPYNSNMTTVSVVTIIKSFPVVLSFALDYGADTTILFVLPFHRFRSRWSSHAVALSQGELDMSRQLVQQSPLRHYEYGYPPLLRTMSRDRRQQFVISIMKPVCSLDIHPRCVIEISSR